MANDLKNAEVLKEHYLKLWNNHNDTKYDETILNGIDKQPKNLLPRDTPIDKEIQKVLSKWHTRKVLVQMVSPREP